MRNMNIFGKVKEFDLFNYRKLKTVTLFSDVKNGWKSTGKKIPQMYLGQEIMEGDCSKGV